MTSRVAATRYARALFDVALAEGQDLDQIGRELSETVALVSGNGELARALTHAAIPAARKRAVVEALLSHSSVNVLLARTLLLLADRDRLALLPRLRRAFRSRLMDHQQVVRAEVTTAMELPADRVRRCSRAWRRRPDGPCSSTCASIRRLSAARSRNREHGVRRQRHDAAGAVETQLVEADTAGI